PFWKTCTVRVRRAVYGARYEASRLGNRSLEPYHLLLALLREDWDLVRRLLLAEAETETIGRRLESPFKSKERVPTSAKLPPRSESKQVLARAASEAKQMGHDRIGTGHLLLGLLGDEGSITAKLLGEPSDMAEKPRPQIRSQPEGRQSVV